MTITNDSTTIVIPLRWAGLRRLRRAVFLGLLALIGCILVPAPLLLINAISYFIGITVAGLVATLIVRRRMKSEEKKSIYQHGPFVRITRTHIHFPESFEPSCLALDGTRIRHWSVPHSPGNRRLNIPDGPPMALINLQGEGHHITLIGEDFINLEPFPLITRKESMGRIAGSTVLWVDVEALLRAHPFMHAFSKAIEERKAPPLGGTTCRGASR